MKQQTDPKQRIDLIINLMISGGVPFMAFLMGLFFKEVWLLSVLGFAHIVILSSLFLLKVLITCKSKRVKSDASFFIMINLAIPFLAFFAGENYLGSLSSVIIITLLTMVSSGVFYSVYSKDSTNSPSLLKMRLRSRCEDHD